MSEVNSPENPPPPEETTPTRLVLCGFVTATLLAAMLVYQGYHAYIAFNPDDTNHLETPLLLATAQQLADGPSTLYGPFTGTNHLVLMHAPLYYRIAGLAAWGLNRAGGDPIVSTMIAGRSLAFFGLLLTLSAAWKIARLDGSSYHAGLWAVLLIGSSPVFGSFGFTVRPDTLGIGLQTLGFGLILGGLRRERSSSIVRWLAAGACFGVVICVKQHLVVTAGVGGLLLLVASMRGRASWRSLVVFVVAAAVIPLLYYSWEEYVTGGLMSRSVFRLPSDLRRTKAGSWGHVAAVSWDVAKRSIGELLLGFVVLVVARKAIRGSRLDGALWLVFLAELASIVPLCLGSTGAWSNYAMPAVVWGSILLARTMSRAAMSKGRNWKLWGLFLAGLLLAGNAVRLSFVTATMRREENRNLEQIFADPVVSKTPRDALYFESRPQWNRLYGRPSLAYDSWMLEAFEDHGMTEPRRVWLREILGGTSHSVEVIITPSDSKVGGDHVEGITESLGDLGFRNHQQYERYAVWVRDQPIPAK